MVYIMATSVFWFYFNAKSQEALLDTKVSMLKLIYSQIAGDAYTAILPLAGVGGDPYKIKFLNQYIPIEEAGRVVVLERIMHMVGGFLFGLVFLIASLFLIQPSNVIFSSLLIGILIFAILFAGSTFILLSKVPGKLVGFFLKRFKIVAHEHAHKLSKKAFLKSLFYRFLSRIANFLEIYMIFILLGLNPGIGIIIFVTVVVGVSSILFFFIPQGIGVNELSINTALQEFGYSASEGLSIGLLRRARIILWALLGVLIHLIYIVYKKKKRSESTE